MTLLNLPPDKSLSHRVLFLVAILRVPLQVKNLSACDDVRTTKKILEKLGQIESTIQENRSRSMDVAIRPGPGPESLPAPAFDLNFENSGTTLRFFLGFSKTLFNRNPGLVLHLDGDHSLRLRPLARVLEPLQVHGLRFDQTSLPCRIWYEPQDEDSQKRPEEPIYLESSLRSAQVKTAFFFWALGETKTSTHIEVPTGSRRDTENLFQRFLDPRAFQVKRQAQKDVLHVFPGQSRLRASYPEGIEVPPDASAFCLQCVFWALNKSPSYQGDVDPNLLTRADFLDFFRLFYQVSFRSKQPFRPRTHLPEKVVLDDPVWIASVIDELPYLFVLASFQEGTETVFSGLEELRVKECDRLETSYRILKQAGAQVELRENELRIKGRHHIPQPFSCSRELHQNDHRMAMMVSIYRLWHPTLWIEDLERVAAVSFPDFGDFIQNQC